MVWTWSFGVLATRLWRRWLAGFPAGWLAAGVGLAGRAVLLPGCLESTAAGFSVAANVSCRGYGCRRLPPGGGTAVRYRGSARRGVLFARQAACPAEAG